CGRCRGVAARRRLAPELVESGLHPLDGARYLRGLGTGPVRIVCLVAHHSCAVIEAEERVWGSIPYVRVSSRVFGMIVWMLLSIVYVVARAVLGLVLLRGAPRRCRCR